MSVKKRRYPVSAGLVVVHRYFLVTDTKGTVQTAWTEQEQTAFFDAFALFGKDWKKVSERIGTKSSVQSRYFYYRTTRTIGELLEPEVNFKDIHDTQHIKAIVCLFSELKRLIGFATKTELFKTKFLSWTLSMLSGKLPDELKTLDAMKKCSTPFNDIVDHKQQEQPKKTALPFTPQGDPPPQEQPPFPQHKPNQEALETSPRQEGKTVEHAQKAQRFSIAGYPSVACSTPLSSNRNKCNETLDLTPSQKNQTETLSPIDKKVHILLMPKSDIAKQIVRNSGKETSFLKHVKQNTTLGSLIRDIQKTWKNATVGEESIFSSLTLHLDAQEDRGIPSCTWTSSAKLRCGELHTTLGKPEVLTLKYDFDVGTNMPLALPRRKPTSRKHSASKSFQQASYITNEHRGASHANPSARQSPVAPPVTKIHQLIPMSLAPAMSSPSPMAVAMSTASPDPFPVSFTAEGKKRIAPIVVTPFRAPTPTMEQDAMVSRKQEYRLSSFTQQEQKSQTQSPSQQLLQIQQLQQQQQQQLQQQQLHQQQLQQHSTSFLFKEDSLFPSLREKDSGYDNSFRLLNENSISLLKVIEDEYSTHLASGKDGNEEEKVPPNAIISTNSTLGFDFI